MPFCARSSGSSSSRSLPSKVDLAAGDFVGVAPGQDIRQRAFPGAVQPHDRMDLAGVDRQVDALQYLFLVHPRLQVFNFK